MLKHLLIITCLVFCGHLSAEKTQLLLIRHGETGWNQEKRAIGHADATLNQTGLAQAKQLALQLKKKHPEIVAIYASDLSRAVSTAQEAAELLLLPISLRPSLREIKWGAVEGMLSSEIHELYAEKTKMLDEMYPEREERWNHATFEGAETYNQLLARVKGEVLAIAERHPGEKVAIFTHSKTIKVLIMELTGYAEKNIFVDNCSTAIFEYDPDQPDQPLLFVGIQKLEQPTKTP
jgi:probable phosphoglycerate mutase